MVNTELAGGLGNVTSRAEDTVQLVECLLCMCEAWAGSQVLHTHTHGGCRGIHASGARGMPIMSALGRWKQENQKLGSS